MVKDYYGYGIDENGFIWNKARTAPLKPKLTKDGYYEVCLFIEGKRYYYRVHRLIAMAFVKNENPLDNTIVNHLDGDKTNNLPSNLEWTTISGNTIHAIKNGLYKTPDTSIETKILNTLTNEVLVFKSRRECEEYFGSEFRSICGSRQCKKYSHLKEVD